MNILGLLGLHRFFYFKFFLSLLGYFWVIPPRPPTYKVSVMVRPLACVAHSLSRCLREVVAYGKNQLRKLATAQCELNNIIS